MTVTWEVLDSIAAVEPTVADWDRLAVALGLPYCAPAWLLSWWKHAAPKAAQLRILLFWQDSELVGVAPFYAVPWRAGLNTWCLLGTAIASRIEPLAEPALREQVERALPEALSRAAPAADRISLEGLPARSPWPDAIHDGWPGRGRPWAYAEASTPAPVIVLGSGDLDGWLATRSSNFRQQMRRARRKLDDAGAVFRVASTPDELDRDLPEFERLHNARWDWRGGSDALTPGTDRMLADAGRELVGSGRFHLISLELEGKVVSSQLFVAAGAEISYWNGGFDDDYAQYKPALVGLVEAVRLSLEKGYERFDLGPGGQDYKYRFSVVQDELVSRTLIPPGLRRPAATAIFAPKVARQELSRRLTDRQKQRVRKLLGRPA